MDRRTFLKTIGCSAAASLVTCCPIHISPSHKHSSLEKVLLIGIDGLRPDALWEAATPNIDALAAEGAYSFAARTGEHTFTGPGWSNVLTGVWENKHGVKDNTFKGANYEKYPTIFSRIEEIKPILNTSSVASLDWINDIIITKADNRIYYPFEEEGDIKVAESTADIIKYNNVDLMFAYFEGVDVAGHSYGFDTVVTEYLAEIEIIDHYVGLLMQAMQKRPAYREERWLTILTSDHGGKGKHHGGVGEEAQKIPLIMHGSAVQKGEISPVPRQVDIVPTILTYFGIPLQDNWGLDGKVIGLK